MKEAFLSIFPKGHRAISHWSERYHSNGTVVDQPSVRVVMLHNAYHPFSRLRRSLRGTVRDLKILRYVHVSV